MPRGIPNKNPRPSVPLGLVKPVARIEDKLDRLIEAQTALIAELHHLVLKLNNPVVSVTATGLAPFKGFGGADQTMGKPGAIFVPRGTLSETSPDPETEARLDQFEAAVAILSEGSPEDTAFDGPDDPVASLYDELASYTDEDEAPPPPLEEAELWGKRLHAWRANRLWMPDWGPRPGQADCQVPPYLMMNGR